MNPTKPAWLSKTVLLNLVALLCAFIPAVGQWIATNPETAASVIAAANIILRFITKGAISITGAGETAESGGASLVLLLGTAALFMGSAPSCSSDQLAAARNIPIRTTIYTDYGTATYSSKGGLALAVDRRSGK